MMALKLSEMDRIKTGVDMIGFNHIYRLICMVSAFIILLKYAYKKVGYQKPAF